MKPRTNQLFYTVDQAAAYLNVNPRTLERWRHDGDGPRYVKMKRMLRYRGMDLDAWAEQCLRSHTSEVPARVKVNPRVATHQSTLVKLSTVDLIALVLELLNALKGLGDEHLCFMDCNLNEDGSHHAECAAARAAIAKAEGR